MNKDICDRLIQYLPITLKQNRHGYKGKCPVCHDTKVRFHILWNRSKQYYTVLCHNDAMHLCTNLESFVREYYPEIAKQFYTVDNLIGMRRSKRKYEMDFTKVVKSTIPKIISDKMIPEDCISLLQLNDDHKVKQYVKSRKIPIKHYKNLYYIDDFSKLAAKYGYKKFKKDARLIIPFWDFNGKLTYIQARSLDKNSEIRYITLELDPRGIKVWGLHEVSLKRRIWITEGPLDATFLPNSLAMAGSSVSNEELKRMLLGKIEPKDIIFVYDNEPRKPMIKKQIMSRIDAGFSVVIWDKSIVEKDINDMVLNESFDINTIESYVYSGLQAKIKLKLWR